MIKIEKVRFIEVNRQFWSLQTNITLLHTFIIEWNVRFQLDVSKNLYFFPSAQFTELLVMSRLRTDAICPNYHYSKFIWIRLTWLSHFVGNILPVSKTYLRFQASSQCFRVTYQSRLQGSSSRRRLFDIWKWDQFVVRKHRYGISHVCFVKPQRTSELISDFQKFVAPPFWNELCFKIPSRIFPKLIRATH